MTSVSHKDTNEYVTTRPLAEDIKRHVTMLANRLNSRGIPLDLDFITYEGGVEYASLDNAHVSFSIEIDGEVINVLCNGLPVGHWTDIASFSAEAEEVVLMSWRQVLMH